jgi:hypothetical protein
LILFFSTFYSAANNIGYEDHAHFAAMSSRKNPDDTLENILDIREYDVPYYVRVAMDLGKKLCALMHTIFWSLTFYLFFFVLQISV